MKGKWTENVFYTRTYLSTKEREFIFLLSKIGAFKVYYNDMSAEMVIVR